VRSFTWCKSVEESFAGIAIPGVVGVFLFRIEPVQSEVDSWLWVVVGDLPPAYLVVDDAPNPPCALKAYIDEMQRWVDAVKAGGSLEDVIPVNVTPTIEHARMLEQRLRFLAEEIVG